MLNCPHTGCQYDTGQVLIVVMNPTLDKHIAMLGHHIQGAHQPAPAYLNTTRKPTPPQLQPPPVQNVTRFRQPCEWKDPGNWLGSICDEWANFMVAGHLQTGTEKHQLGSVLGATYTKIFGRLGPATYKALTEQLLLDNAKLLVINRRNKNVHRYKLNTMKQDHDEPAIGFESRLQPAARTGKFKKKGKCKLPRWDRGRLHGRNGPR